jgi:hypothetical protein
MSPWQLWGTFRGPRPPQPIFGWRDWAIDGFVVAAIIIAAVTASYLL